MTPLDPRPSESRPWEVERDRFGVMFSGPLEVGECIEVVSASVRVERDHYRSFLRAMAAHSGTPAHIRQSVREVLEEGPRDPSPHP